MLDRQVTPAQLGPLGGLIEGFLVRIAAARVFILFVFHAFVFTAAYLFAWFVRFEFRLPSEFTPLVLRSAPYVILIQLAVAIAFGFLRGWWRYVGVTDVLRLVAGTTTALVVLNAAWYASDAVHFMPFVGVSRGVLLIDWAFALLGLFGARVAVRVGKDFGRSPETVPELRRVLIVGAGDAGEALAREIQHRPQLGLKVVGFVDDQRAKWNSQIRGVDVTGPIASIGSIAEARGATEALLAIPTATGKRVRELVEHLAAAHLHFRTIPGLDQLVSGKVHVAQLRNVNIDDLLRRKEVVVSADRVRAFFFDKTIVISGAGGTVGSELAQQVLQYEPRELHLIERSEYALYECIRRLETEKHSQLPKIVPHLLDCTDAADLLVQISPEIVIHAAAHKHVPLGEQNPVEYVRNNCIAAVQFARYCEAAGVRRFVFISTDKAIKPISAMGASKRAAEIALLDAGRRSRMDVMAVRFGNVLGSSGSVVPLFLQQIAAGGPVTVTHPDATRYFLRVSEAISLVLQAAALGNNGSIYMLDMGDPMRIADLARDLIRLSNPSQDVQIAYTGLRPGEKLHEELRGEFDVITATEHPHIYSMIVPQPGETAVFDWYRRLDAAIRSKAASTIDIVRELVPEYGISEAADNRSSVRASEQEFVERLVN